MIQSKELRIGNYVAIDGLLQVVSEIRMQENDTATEPLVGYLVEHTIQYAPLQDGGVQGVVLTDEVLKRCGFQFDTYFKLWKKMKQIQGTGVDMELDRDYSALDFSHRPILKDIQHLHHLQNLYYALKRNELPIDMMPNQKIPSKIDINVIQD